MSSKLDDLSGLVEQPKKEKKPIKISKQTRDLLIIVGILLILLVILFFVLKPKNTNVEQLPMIETTAVDNQPIAPPMIINPDDDISIPPVEVPDMFDTSAIEQAQAGNELGGSVKAQLDERKSTELKEQQAAQKREEMKKFLNTIKNDIVLIDDAFVYQGKRYSTADFIEDIKVTEIGREYITFAGDGWTYTLRYFGDRR